MTSCSAKWKEAYWPRDLKALSFEPLLLQPTHFTGEPGYITDTENSAILSDKSSNHGEQAPDSQDHPMEETELLGQKGETPNLSLHSDEL